MDIAYLAFLNPVAAIITLFLENPSGNLFNLEFVIISILTYGLLGFLFTLKKRKIYLPLAIFLLAAAAVFLFYIVSGIAD